MRYLGHINARNRRPVHGSARTGYIHSICAMERRNNVKPVPKSFMLVNPSWDAISVVQSVMLTDHGSTRNAPFVSRECISVEKLAQYNAWQLDTKPFLKEKTTPIGREVTSLERTPEYQLGYVKTCYIETIRNAKSVGQWIGNTSPLCYIPIISWNIKTEERRS